MAGRIVHCQGQMNNIQLAAWIGCYPPTKRGLTTGPGVMSEETERKADDAPLFAGSFASAVVQPVLRFSYEVSQSWLTPSAGGPRTRAWLTPLLRFRIRTASLSCR